MSGIEEERIINSEIIELIKDSILCKKCSLICFYPMYCPKCEISFCGECINNTVKCEICKTENLKIFPNIFKNFYNLMQIKCKNINCEKVFLYEDLEKHQKECDFNNNNNKFVLLSKENSNLLEESIYFEKISLSKINEENCESINSFLAVDNMNKKDIKELSDVNESKQEENEKNISFSFVTNNDFSYIQSVDGEEIYKNKDDFNQARDFQQESNKEYLVNFEAEKKVNDVETLGSKVKALESTIINITNELSIIKEFLCTNNSIKSSLNNANDNHHHHHHQNYKAFENKSFNNNNYKQISIPKNILKPSFSSFSNFKKCEFCKSLSSSESSKSCSFCNKNTCISCYSLCVKCKKISCTACSQCSICKSSKLCFDCKKPCSQCQKNSNSFCFDCLKNCEKCGKDFCKICCGFACKDSKCKAVICINCCWNCKICYNTFCEEVKNIVCKFCGVKACEEKCNAVCLLCEKAFCLICIVQCGKCEKKICKGCSVKEVKNKNLFYNCKKCI